MQTLHRNWPRQCLLLVKKMPTGRKITFVGSICGTNADFQKRQDQVQRLADAGIILMDSNAQAARLAGLIATRGVVA